MRNWDFAKDKQPTYRLGKKKAKKKLAVKLDVGNRPIRPPEVAGNSNRRVIRGKKKTKKKPAGTRSAYAKVPSHMTKKKKKVTKKRSQGRSH